MPEIDNVQIGETIAVEWGNAIRDRTIQRYANAAERDELHPNPTEGDLSYLEDTNIVEVYDGFVWTTVTGPLERSGATVETSVNVPATIGNLATVNLNIPSAWSSWNCVAFAHATAITTLNNLGDVGLKIDISNVDGPNFVYHIQGPNPVAVTAASFRSGITTTGNQTIVLRGYRNGPSVSLMTVFLYARAFRTS